MWWAGLAFKEIACLNPASDVGTFCRIIGSKYTPVRLLGQAYVAVRERMKTSICHAAGQAAIEFNGQGFCWLSMSVRPGKKNILSKHKIMAAVNFRYNGAVSKL